MEGKTNGNIDVQGPEGREVLSGIPQHTRH